MPLSSWWSLVDAPSSLLELACDTVIRRFVRVRSYVEIAYIPIGVYDIVSFFVYINLFTMCFLQFPSDISCPP